MSVAPIPQTNTSDTTRAPGPLLSAPVPREEVNQPHHPDPAVLRQPTSLQPVAQPEPRGRTPTRQERSRLSAQNDTAAPQAGGYNFQKIMDDRFEHYKRPASRERSTDRFSRAGSSDRLAAPASRARTPLAALEQPLSDTTGGLESLNLDSLPVKGAVTGNGAAGGKISPQFSLGGEEQIRYRGVQQEIPHFGAPPKRTESLYMKADTQQASFKVLGPSAMQRKKSLPDVATLPTVTAVQGSQAMTREEISVLSSARREEIRRQLEMADRYRANPLLYMFDPQIRVNNDSGRVSTPEQDAEAR